MRRIDPRVHTMAVQIAECGGIDAWRRRNEILYLTWDDVDLAGGIIRLTPQRSKTKTGRVLPTPPHSEPY